MTGLPSLLVAIAVAGASPSDAELLRKVDALTPSDARAPLQPEQLGDVLPGRFLDFERDAGRDRQVSRGVSRVTFSYSTKQKDMRSARVSIADFAGKPEGVRGAMQELFPALPASPRKGDVPRRIIDAGPRVVGTGSGSNGSFSQMKAKLAVLRRFVVSIEIQYGFGEHDLTEVEAFARALADHVAAHPPRAG